MLVVHRHERLRHWRRGAPLPPGEPRRNITLIKVFGCLFVICFAFVIGYCSCELCYNAGLTCYNILSWNPQWPGGFVLFSRAAVSLNYGIRMAAFGRIQNWKNSSVTQNTIMSSATKLWFCYPFSLILYKYEIMSISSASLNSIQYFQIN